MILLLQTDWNSMATARPSRKRGKRPNARDYCGDVKDAPGFEVRFVDDYIGEGVFTTQEFYGGDFLLEYKGDLINYNEALRREKEYAGADLGSFLYFFKYKGKQLCVDATDDIFYQGRMINDAPKGDTLQNCAMKIVVYDNKPHLCAFATRDIVIGEEIRFDYGVADLPWRNKEAIQKAKVRRRDHSPDSSNGQRNGNIRDDNVETIGYNESQKTMENPYNGGVTDTDESSHRGAKTPDVREKEDSSVRHTENNDETIEGRITDATDDCSWDTKSNISAVKETLDSKYGGNKLPGRARKRKMVARELSEDDDSCSEDLDDDCREPFYHQPDSGEVTDTDESSHRGAKSPDVRVKEDSSVRHIENIEETIEGKLTDATDDCSWDTKSNTLAVKETLDLKYGGNKLPGRARKRKMIARELTEDDDPCSEDLDADCLDPSYHQPDSGEVTDTDESSHRGAKSPDVREKEDSSDRHIENIEETIEGKLTDATDDCSWDTKSNTLAVKETLDLKYGGNKLPGRARKRKMIAREHTEDDDPCSEDLDADCLDPSYHQPDSGEVTDTDESSHRGAKSPDVREKEDSSDRHIENIEETIEGKLTDATDDCSWDTKSNTLAVKETLDLKYGGNKLPGRARKRKMIAREHTEDDDPCSEDLDADCLDPSYHQPDSGEVTDTDESSHRGANTPEVREEQYSSVRHTENIEETIEGRIADATDDCSWDTKSNTSAVKETLDSKYGGNILPGRARKRKMVARELTEDDDPCSEDLDDDCRDPSYHQPDSGEVTDTDESSHRGTKTPDVREKEDSSVRHTENNYETIEGRITDATDDCSWDMKSNTSAVKDTLDLKYGRDKWPGRARKRKMIARELTEDDDSCSEDLDDDCRDPSYHQPDSDTDCSTSEDSDDHAEVCGDSDEIALLCEEGLVNSGSISSQDEDTERITSSDRKNDEQYCGDNRDDNVKTDEDRINQRDKRTLIAFRKQMENVSLPLYSAKKDGKRDYRKLNCCFYCERTFTSKISDHYLNIHVDEEEVKKIRLMELRSTKRKTALMELENRGNFKYNVKTIEKGIGELIVARRPNAQNSEKYPSYRFLPCEYCLGFYFDGSLWLHQKSCKLRPLEEQPLTNCMRDSRTMLVPFLQDISDEDAYLENVFNGMKETHANPGIPKLCKNDKLIREFAKSLLYRLGEEDEQRIKDIDNVRTKVRTAGRILQELNTKHGVKTLSEYITPQNFFNVVEGTKSLALKSDSPQIALVLGHYIKQITLLKNSLGIVEISQNEQNEARDFQTLYQAHWNNRVSCVAKRRQRLRQMNKAPEIPHTEDLVTLTHFVKDELQKCIKIQSPDDQTWKKAAQLTLVRIDLFNKRRIAEVQELKVSDYLSAEKNDETDESILNSLDVSDRILSQRMRVIEVKGKSVRGLRKVFVVLTPDMIDALEYLMRTRCGNSPFMFCRKTDKTPLDGCEAMRDVTEMCPGLKYPKRIRSRKIRKYLATTCQLIDMTDSELKLVADHMGHNLNIHTDVYRLQSSLLEKTKVARVLIAMENGCVDKFKGSNISDIQLDSIPEPITYDDAWARAAQSGVEVTETEAAETVAEENFNTVQIDNHNEVDGDTEVSEVVIYSRQQPGMNDSDDDSDIGGSGSKRSKARAHRVIKRVRWDEEENRLFRKEMQHYIDKKTMPPGQRINDLARVLKNRTKAQIRTKIHNIISGKLKTF